MCRIPNSDLGRRVVTVMIGVGRTIDYVRKELDIPSADLAMLKEDALRYDWDTENVGEHIGLTDKTRTDRGITHIRPCDKKWEQHQSDRRKANRKRAKDERPRPGFRALPDLGLKGRDHDLHCILADRKMWTRLSALADKVRGMFLWSDLSETALRREMLRLAYSLAERKIIELRMRRKGRKKNSAKWVEVRVRPPRFRAYDFSDLGDRLVYQKAPLSGVAARDRENVSISKASKCVDQKLAENSYSSSNALSQGEGSASSN